MVKPQQMVSADYQFHNQVELALRLELTLQALIQDPTRDLHLPEAERVVHQVVLQDSINAKKLK